MKSPIGSPKSNNLKSQPGPSFIFHVCESTISNLKSQLHNLKVQDLRPKLQARSSRAFVSHPELHLNRCLDWRIRICDCSQQQRFRVRAGVSSGHAVWPAMRTGENASAHAKTLPRHSSESPHRCQIKSLFVTLANTCPCWMVADPISVNLPIRKQCARPKVDNFPRQSLKLIALYSRSPESRNVGLVVGHPFLPDWRDRPGIISHANFLASRAIQPALVESRPRILAMAVRWIRP